MKARFLMAIGAILLISAANAQDKQPVIRSNSNIAYIKEEGKATRIKWNIVPTQKLDIYGTSAKKVTFYTDVDSISFKVKPQTGICNFTIVVNGKDSARTQIKYQPSKLDVLKKAAKYNPSDSRYIPDFTYQAANNPNLVRIRTELKLDSIAGTGSQTLKILNLLHWVHTTVRHDGSSTNPKIKNAIDLLNVCKAEKRGINCRMMATMLNECYLAMGIKSRFITCMPKELEFDDCHVINMVYSDDLKKWLWIDPTFDAYVMDEKGVLLSIQEVRERLIKGLPLILNPSANWNNEQQQVKEEYLENYMAKNLYRFETPLSSEYNTETRESGKTIQYVELLPLDAVKQEPQKTEETNINTGVKFLNYKTNNPNLFWANPK